MLWNWRWKRRQGDVIIKRKLILVCWWQRTLLQEKYSFSFCKCAKSKCYIIWYFSYCLVINVEIFFQYFYTRRFFTFLIASQCSIIKYVAEYRHHYLIIIAILNVPYFSKLDSEPTRCRNQKAPLYTDRGNEFVIWVNTNVFSRR